VVRRALVVAVAAALVVLLVVPVALAARVTVRVEGRSQTIFAPAPRLVDAQNALQALELASLAGEFYYHVSPTSFGPYVDQIGRFPAAGAAGWVFKVNGASPPVGADKVELRDGDVVLWHWADFDPVTFAGPLTLDLRREGACYRVWKLDDQGRRTAATGATLHYDGKRAAARTGRACLPRHTSLVRATLTGAVRSNALR
jgi:Domain of unknown function (DUF4430)